MTEKTKCFFTLLEPSPWRLAVTLVNQLHRAQSWCVGFFFFNRSCFLPLESDVLGWAADSSKHHCLRTCGCFTFVKRKCRSATYIDYTSQLEFGSFFAFQNIYIFPLVLCTYSCVGRFFSRGDMLTSKKKKKQPLTNPCLS